MPLDTTRTGLAWPVMIMKVLKEPLFHFVLLGAALFGAGAWMNPAPENPNANRLQQVHIGAGDVEWLVENWTTQWRRPPTPEEVRGLITEYLNEQLLAREARALGLEDNDVIIRRRLAQKLTFLIEDTLRRAEPSEPELQLFFESHSQRFRSDARISFSHIYFNPQRRANARSDASDALKLLIAQGSPLVAGEVGDRSLVETEFLDQTQQSISNAFGPDFARTVFSLRPAVWSGPIESGYGLHLVRISTLEQAEMRPFSDIRGRVVEEWRREQETLAKERYLAELSKKYGLIIDGAVKPLIAPTIVVKTGHP